MDRKIGNKNRHSTPPVKEGEEIDVHIEAVGEKGDGIAKKNGFVIFVPKTQVGQNVRIKITRVLKSVSFGEVIGEATSKPIKSAPKFVDQTQEELKQKPEQEEFFEDSEDFGNEEEDK